MRALSTQTAKSVFFTAPGWQALNTEQGILEAITRALARPLFTSLDCGTIRSSRLFGAVNQSSQTLSGTPTTIQIGTLVGGNNTNSYSLSSGEVIIIDSGIYQIVCKMSTDSINGARSVARSYLEVDEGSGFVKVDNSDIFNYNRNASAGKQTSTHFGIYEIAAGTIIRIRSNIEDGSGIATIAGACQLSINPADISASLLDGHQYDCGVLTSSADPQSLINCGELG